MATQPPQEKEKGITINKTAFASKGKVTKLFTTSEKLNTRRKPWNY